MDVSELLDRARENFGVSRVFGAPITSGDALVIPVARIQGGAGGGGGKGTEESNGMGAGYGISARPAGAYIVRGEKVSWRPAVDVNRVILGAQLVAATALIAFATLGRRPKFEAARIRAGKLRMRRIFKR